VRWTRLTEMKDKLPIASWRVTRDGLMVTINQYHGVIPFGQFGGLVLALLKMMKDREGRDGDDKP
jgi:hypothetical protein